MIDLQSPTLTTVLIWGILQFGAPTHAGEWHTGDDQVCEDCHVQHSSETTLRGYGAPNPGLLLRSSVNDLCLSCHDGNDPSAPDVLAPVNMYESGSAAGFLLTPGQDNPQGHNLSMGRTTPLQIERRIMELDCSDCHAVHGNSNYRNLLHDPAGHGDSLSLVVGSHVFAESQPGRPPTPAATVAAYGAENIGYRSGYSDWCLACHDGARGARTASRSAHFSHHPVGVSFDAFAQASHADVLHWRAGTGKGFYGTGAARKASSAIPRVPFEAPESSDYITAKQPASSNEVFCGSCHKAHGGRHLKALLWSYMEGEDDFIAGCQQCHNK